MSLDACARCLGTLRLTARPHLYRASPAVVLVGLSSLVCMECNHERLQIPARTELEQLLRERSDSGMLVLRWEGEWRVVQC